MEKLLDLHLAIEDLPSQLRSRSHPLSLVGLRSHRLWSWSLDGHAPAPILDKRPALQKFHAVQNVPSSFLLPSLSNHIRQTSCKYQRDCQTPSLACKSKAQGDGCQRSF